MLIADEHTLVREGMKMLVSGVLPTAAFVEASDADSLLRAAAHPAVCMAVIDLHLPGMQGGVRLLELAQRFARLPLIVISALTSVDVARRITNIHTVHAFVPKSSDTQTIHRAIEATLQGRKWLPPLPKAMSAGAVTLTPRQQEICALLRQGLSNKMIASELGISTGTVKNHITEIFRIFNTTNRTQVAQLDLRQDRSA